jgi:hypothetical protein
MTHHPQGEPRRRWGKAGIRLTPAQATAANARHRRRAAESAELTRRDDALARRAWAAGLISPCAITIALDAQGLYGPDVDRACLAEEPDVDLWETGKLYPRWDQLVALATLTHVTPRWFTNGPHTPLSCAATSMQFHLPEHDRVEYQPITRFADVVVAQCPETDLWKQRQ